MPGVRDFRITQPTNDIGELMHSLVFVGEAEAAPNIYPVAVALITIDRLARWGRESYVGDRALDMSHVPAPEVAGVIAKLLSLGTQGRHEQPGAFEPPRRHYERFCPHAHPAADMRTALKMLGSAR